MRNHFIVGKAIKKALQSPCRHRICAISFDRKGNLLGFTANTPGYFSSKGAGIHAEQKAIQIWKTRIKTILMCRANKSGQLLPIHPCEKCSKLSKKYGITIRTIEDKRRFEEYERKRAIQRDHYENSRIGNHSSVA